jgi:Acyl-CoA dehydrogenases
MDFKLTKEQELIQKAAREFAEKRIAPLCFKIDQENEVPLEILKELGELELAGLPYKEEYGGSDAGYISYVLMVEQLGRFSSGVSTTVTVNNLFLAVMNLFGSEEQKQKWMPPCCRLEQIGSFAFTEPGTGSDPKALTSKAALDGDEWVINGTKRFITNAGLKGPMVIIAIDDQSGKPSAFVMDKFCPGYSVSEPWDKMGQKGTHTYDVYMKDIRIPKDNILGKPGMGFNVLLQNITYGKLGVSANALGRAQGALEEAVKYISEKRHRGEPISKFPTMRARIATMEAKVQAARMLVYRLADLTQQKVDPVQLAKESAMTKLFVGEASMDVVREALQAHGSYGVIKEYRVEMLYRDAILGEVVEGSKDLQQMIVANYMLP